MLLNRVRQLMIGYGCGRRGRHYLLTVLGVKYSVLIGRMGSLTLAPLFIPEPFL